MTESVYREDADRLIDRFLQTQSGRPDAIDFVQWFCERCEHWAPSTRRLRRQAALTALNYARFDNTDLAHSILEEKDLGTIAYGQGENTTRKSSICARKYIPWTDWRRVDAHLQVLSKSRMAPLVRSWLRAGLATGLRPSEWLGSCVELHSSDAVAGGESEIHLNVRSLKTDNDRGLGPVRTIDITNLTKTSLSAVDVMCAEGRECDKHKFSDLERRAAGVLYSACQALFLGKRRYSLYSCRHQFVANQKACGVPVIEIAAMVGHRIDISTDRVYAKKSAAWPDERIEDRPRGVAAEIALVTQRERFSEKARAAIARAGSRAPNQQG